MQGKNMTLRLSLEQAEALRAVAEADGVPCPRLHARP